MTSVLGHNTLTAQFNICVFEGENLLRKEMLGNTPGPPPVKLARRLD